MARKTDARAVFHDRAAVEEAVRALELEGVRRPRIHIYRADTTGRVVRVPPERSSALAIGGGLGAVVGLGLAILSLVVTPGPLPFFFVLVRAAAGIGAGALIGALVALISSRLRHESRYEQPTGYRDFLVKVDASDDTSADQLRDLLARAGGDPVVG